MIGRLLDKMRLSLLRALLPKDEKLKEELAKLWLPRSPHSIWLGWDDVDMGGKRIRRVGTPIEDEDVARKKDVEQAGMPVGEAGDMIYHDGEKWTALKAPAAEKWLKHPGDGAAPEWADLPVAGDPYTDYIYVWYRVFNVDTIYTWTSGSGVVAGYEVWGARLGTGTTADSYATIQLGIGLAGAPFTWDKPRKIRWEVYLETGLSYGHVYFGTGWFELGATAPSSYEHIGFHIVEGALYGTSGDGSAGSEIDLGVTLSPDQYWFEIHFYPGDRAEYYLNGSLLGTKATNLPSGDRYSSILLRASVRNTSANNLIANFYDIEVSQKR